MTMHEPITMDGATEAPDDQQLALPPNLADLCEGRDRAIELYADLYDRFHSASAAAAAASVGGAIPFGSPGDDRYSGSSFTRALLLSGTTSRNDRETGRRIESTAREDFVKIISNEVDRRCWRNLLEKVGFDQLLDAQARDEWHKSLETDPPAFALDTVTATFGHLWLNRREMYLRGIANVFMQLDRRFRSHDAFAIGNRIVFSNALSIDYSGWSHYDRGKRDAFDDVERIFRELDGLGPLGYDQRISQRVAVSPSARPHRIEGAYFKVDAFKNGNVHLWFTRKDLLAQVNALLLEYYKPVEGDVGEGPSYEAGPLYHQTPAKDHGFFPSPQPVADAVIARAELRGRADYSGAYRDEWKPLRVLEPSAGMGAIALAARAKGHHVDCIEIQPHLAAALRMAGGELAVRCTDFLTTRPDPIYDYVLMNPPFDRGRDCDHVRHAYQFLKPGGVLVAVMSARAEHATDKRHAALHDLIKQSGDRYGRAWQDLPERSFASTGTNVNTVLLRIAKPRI